MRYFYLSEVEGAAILDTRDLDDCLRTLDAQSDDEDEREIYAALDNLRDEIGREWKDGVTLIREDHFEGYARDEANDIWGVDKMGTLESYIDWGRWAEDLRNDYQSVEVGDTTFLYRG